ncbi:hypothetical protein A4Z71_05325 [Candidatus Rhodoluna planktonica]|jgi:hypothetical protein|uniref:Metallopeptidase family protein n=2 Tax=Candidatus Rhodoluna planktonica TaxID=535712 RepID=A0A1D9DZY6_9MICO|nr:hypothetical protein A4Z71_05325 [Candidatus Rhodoluna planktonica]
MRRSLLGHLRIIGRGPSSFEQIVEGACDFLRHAYPEDLGSMRCLITDAPAVSESSEGVKRWAARPEDLTIVIYRLPIERLGHVRRTDPMHERMHIEEYVFQAAAALIGKDPWDLLGGD